MEQGRQHHTEQEAEDGREDHEPDCGRRHLDHVLRRYAEHYNAQRPHRGLELRTPAGVAPREFVPDVQRVRRIDVLGGLICEYESVAA